MGVEIDDVEALIHENPLVFLPALGRFEAGEELLRQVGGVGKAGLRARRLDADGGDAVGALHGIGDGQARGEEVGEAADEGVAGAGGVDGLDGIGRHMDGLIAGDEEAAAFAEGEDDAGRAALQDGLGGGFGLLDGGDGHAGE